MSETAHETMADGGGAAGHWTRELQPGDEDLRFLRSLHDFFIAIGLGIFLLGAAMATQAPFGAPPMVDFENFAVLEGMAAALRMAIQPVLMLALGFLLAEFFARKKRMFFPSFVLSVFVFIHAITAARLIAAALFGAPIAGAIGIVNGGDIPPALIFATLLIAAAGVFGLTYAFYKRTRFPAMLLFCGFAFAGIVSALVFLVFSIVVDLNAAERVVPGVFAAVLAVAGGSLLVTAVRYDIRDPERRSRLSDCGFWLHAAAAPSLVLAVVTVSALIGNAGAAVFGAVVTIFGIAGLGFLALALDRRALVVSGIVSFTVAVGVLLSEAFSGFDARTVAPLTLVAVGGTITLLGVGWRPARRALLSVLPRRGVWSHVFPPEAAAA